MTINKSSNQEGQHEEAYRIAHFNRYISDDPSGWDKYGCVSKSGAIGQANDNR
jgi:hypothetical protein